MKIFIQSLKQGISEVRETIQPDFLPEDVAGFYPGPLDVHAVIDKFEHDIRIKVDFRTEAAYECDRCLDHFHRQVTGSFQQIYTLGSDDLSDDIEILKLASDAREIDISPLLREAVLLNHPIKMLCDPECKGICPNCGVDLNKEACQCSGGGTDPRWDELKKLIK